MRLKVAGPTTQNRPIFQEENMTVLKLPVIRDADSKIPADHCTRIEMLLFSTSMNPPLMWKEIADPGTSLVTVLPVSSS